jgi:hypothetical protein
MEFLIPLMPLLPALPIAVAAIVIARMWSRQRDVPWWDICSSIPRQRRQRRLAYEHHAPCSLRSGAGARSSGRYRIFQPVRTRLLNRETIPRVSTTPASDSGSCPSMRPQAATPSRVYGSLTLLLRARFRSRSSSKRAGARQAHLPPNLQMQLTGPRGRSSVRAQHSLRPNSGSADLCAREPDRLQLICISLDNPEG